ncbi:MAG: hypothetical protein KAS23_05920 [Anaerohalosphaera sp.]|nr:hypothetical protein [Anaerohalosphaera sp.]
MSKVIFVIAIMAILEGVALIVRPDIYKKIVEFFSRGKMTWFAALLNIIVGVILLMAVTICKPQMQWLILTIGVVSCVGGTAMFFIKQAKLKSLFVWLSCRGNWFYRIVGLLEIALGSVLIYSI